MTCKRKDVLKLTLEDYKKNAYTIEERKKLHDFWPGERYLIPGLDSPRLDEILRTRKIAPELLRSHEFESFISDRTSIILDLIEAGAWTREFLECCISGPRANRHGLFQGFISTCRLLVYVSVL